MEMYTGWLKVPQGLSTKTRLKKEYGLRPGKECDPVAIVKGYTPIGQKEFDLYQISDCIEIKKRKIDINNLTMDDKTLSDALYIINKSAKKSRDTKQENYDLGRHGIVSASKTRQSKLYELKDKVIGRLEQQGRLTFLGYHTQFEQVLWSYQIGNHTFHMPGFKYTGLKFLGDLTEKIKAAQTKQTDINYFQSVKILEEYLAE